MEGRTIGILVLGLISLAIVILMAIIVLNDKAVPDGLWVTLGGAVGAIGGVVAPKASNGTTH